MTDVARLLLVDDEPDLLDVLEEYFSGRYAVTTAISGAVAVERFIKQRPDAVFLDVNMPGVSGLHVLRLFREADPGVPIIMMTANDLVSVAEDCLKHGAFAYVPKPFKLAYMDHIAAIAVAQRRPKV